jgi:hypothetical protein
MSIKKCICSQDSFKENTADTKKLMERSGVNQENMVVFFVLARQRKDENKCIMRSEYKDA